MTWSCIALRIDSFSCCWRMPESIWRIARSSWSALLIAPSTASRCASSAALFCGHDVAERLERLHLAAHVVDGVLDAVHGADRLLDARDPALLVLHVAAVLLAAPIERLHLGHRRLVRVEQTVMLLAQAGQLLAGRVDLAADGLGIAAQQLERLLDLEERFQTVLSETATSTLPLRSSKMVRIRSPSWMALATWVSAFSCPLDRYSARSSSASSCADSSVIASEAFLQPSRGRLISSSISVLILTIGWPIS